jgi:hypothetical protein
MKRFARNGAFRGMEWQWAEWIMKGFNEHPHPANHKLEYPHLEDLTYLACFFAVLREDWNTSDQIYFVAYFCAGACIAPKTMFLTKDFENDNT